MNDAATAIVLELDRELAVPPERVFRAWTEPAELVRWFCPSPDLPTDAEPVRMLVTVTFEPLDGGGSRLRLRHERFAHEDERASHASGWSASLARLPGALGGSGDGEA